MTTPGSPHQPLPILDRLRVTWACARYDLWLDLRSVPRRHRSQLRRELKANLIDASADVGAAQALANVGSLRQLATDTVDDGRLRSSWLVGVTAGMGAMALFIVLFMVATLYYAEGVLDAGVTEPISSGLFPFVGSKVTVDPSNGGIAWTIETGPAPLVIALVTGLVVARPWRSLRRLLH